MSVADDVHGDEWARGVRADHAVNVATGGPPDWLWALLRRELDSTLGAYPDEREAAAAIAFRHGREADEVVLLNGAAHGFSLIAEALAPRRPLVIHPQFTEPDRALAAAGRPAEHVVLSDPYRLDGRTTVPDDADLVVIGNPTNPTGVLHSRAAIARLAAPGRVVVVDEAFMDFVAGERESLTATKDEGLIVVRSLTKILAVPGLRVGYLLAPPPLARTLRARRPAWPVNALALAAARAAAHHPERLAPVADRARRDRDALQRALAAVPGARVHPGAANFLLVELPGRADATTVAHTLRERHGIATRPAGTFPGLTPSHLRLTARGGEADARLVAALQTVVDGATLSPRA